MDETFFIVENAVHILRQGGVIAYPTEAVFGLGCDPFNADAVSRILQIKHRAIKKGFILIAANWQQVEYLVDPINPHALARVFSTWPGPVTWVFPASAEVPFWVRGEHKTVAIRLTAHPLAAALCEQFGKPIISTSANQEGAPPVRDMKAAEMTFANQVDMIVPGQVSGAKRPTEIRDAITGEVLRPG